MSSYVLIWKLTKIKSPIAEILVIQLQWNFAHAIKSVWLLQVVCKTKKVI